LEDDTGHIVAMKYRSIIFEQQLGDFIDIYETLLDWS
jgi:hypothetical protein